MSVDLVCIFCGLQLHVVREHIAITPGFLFSDFFHVILMRIWDVEHAEKCGGRYGESKQSFFEVYSDQL